jgi:hypothetical protein
MKKKYYYLLPLAGWTLAWATALTGQTVRIDGEVRSRTEYREGFRKPLADSLAGTTVSLLRTRLRMAYADEKIEAKIALQDARVYGQAGTNDTRSSLGVFEAWGSYRVAPALTATVGRQGIEYDDKRLLTVSNWSQTGSAHDLLLVKYEPAGRFRLHWGLAWNNVADSEHERLYAVERSYKALTYLWLGASVGLWDLSALWIDDVFDQEQPDAGTWTRSFRHTLGGNLGLKRAEVPLSLYATAYYQFGRDPRNAPLDACLLAAKLQYRIGTAWEATAGIDYFSGSTAQEQREGNNHTFNKLYGSNNSFNGMMEYWTTLPAQGLCNAYGGLAFRPGAAWSVEAIVHTFAVAEKLEGTDRKNIGAEIDLTLRCDLTPQLAVQGGWSVYFRNRQTDLLKATDTGARLPRWGYVALTFKPRFLNND